MYSLEFRERVVRDFNKIPQKEKTKIWKRILKLKNEPRGRNKKISWQR